MNVRSMVEAHSILEKLPLGQAKLMEFEYIELSPLTPLHLLLTEGWANGVNDPSKNVDRGCGHTKGRSRMAASLPFRRNADYLRAIWNVLPGFTGALATSS
jgi:hypothetical protein